MAKYLFRASLSQTGVQGTLKEGGGARRAAIERLIQSVGGTLEAFYYAFGEDDIYIVADCPDHISTAAISMAIAASGLARITTTVLLTPEEMDQVVKKKVIYRLPRA